ncbi:MAG: hypothetical protein E6H00_15965 [Bacillati bacterium ANGP1]|uniref:Flagellar protein FlgN n=1 Tax=Candidatus Segetimicrobium genomatis TaxID=2569760 RepID=A0A537JV21_9BACT|nr:MAG: hypothetical protein E6H00_15965 [Terrabacteria group bacterium ANGP1]
MQAILQDLTTILNILEGRALYLIKEGVRGAIAPDGVVSELAPLLRDLKACYRRLTDVQERQDLSYDAARQLDEADRRCVWLFRKIRLQQVFLTKLSLEARFRSLVSTEAYDIYQTLLNQDEEERDALSGDDARIRVLLLEEQPERSASPKDSG